MKDLYEQFAYDYDEFGSIDAYLGDEKSFNAYGKQSIRHCIQNTVR